MQLLFLKQGTIILYSCKHSTGFYGVLNQKKIKITKKPKVFCQCNCYIDVLAVDSLR